MGNLVELINERERDIQERLTKIRNAKYLEMMRSTNIKLLEKQKYDEFKEIIKGEKYFRRAHFDKLGIDYDILIHVSSKNAGKTTETYRIIQDCLRKKKKFVFGRIYQNELDNDIGRFELDEMSPVIALKHGQQYKFFKKSDIQRYRELMEESILLKKTKADPNKITAVKLLDKGFDYVGLSMTFMNSNIIGGGNYRDFDCIIFDEILSYAATNRLNDRIRNNWGAAVSTILRNKSNIKIYWFGNLQPDITFSPILQIYGINLDDDLRIIKRGDDEECTILYINSGGLYEGSIVNQGGVTRHTTVEHIAFLESNKPLYGTTKIIGYEAFMKMKTKFAFACNCALHDAPLVFEVRGWEEEGNRFWAIHSFFLTVAVCSPEIILTDDDRIYAEFDYVRKGEVMGIYNLLYNLMNIRKLYYTDSFTMENWTTYCREVRNKYIYDYIPKSIVKKI